MNFINIYRYISGFVGIRIEKGFTERFFNLCNIKGIPVWNVRYENDVVFLNLYASDFPKLRQIREKSGVSIRITDKNGLRIFFNKHKKRKGLVGGMILALMFMFTMNMFVWSIEVAGTNNFSNEQIKEVTEKLGLHIGMFVPSFNESSASRNAVNNFDGKISWMAINIKGSKAIVEVREYIETDDKKTIEEPCNLVSDTDGIIVNTKTFSGEQKAFPGQLIKKGSLLVSGIFENTDGSVNYTYSDGLFSALTRRSFRKKYPTEIDFYHKDIRDKYYVLELMHLKVPLSYNAFFKTENEMTYDSHLLCNEKELPFTLKKTSIFNENTVTAENVPLIFFIDDFTSCEYDTFSMSRILESNYVISGNMSEISVLCNYKNIEFIGEKVQILKEN